MGGLPKVAISISVRLISLLYSSKDSRNAKRVVSRISATGRVYHTRSVKARQLLRFRLARYRFRSHGRRSPRRVQVHRPRPARRLGKTLGEPDRQASCGRVGSAVIYLTSAGYEVVI